jgi:hypothetical protein
MWELDFWAKKTYRAKEPFPDHTGIMIEWGQELLFTDRVNGNVEVASHASDASATGEHVSGIAGASTGSASCRVVCYRRAAGRPQVWESPANVLAPPFAPPSVAPAAPTVKL